MLVEVADPVAPTQLKKAYSSEGVAFNKTVSPSSNREVSGVNVPPSGGLDEVVRVYNIGSSVQEITTRRRKILKVFS